MENALGQACYKITWKGTMAIPVLMSKEFPPGHCGDSRTSAKTWIFAQGTSLHNIQYLAGEHTPQSYEGCDKARCRTLA